MRNKIDRAWALVIELSHILVVYANSAAPGATEYPYLNNLGAERKI